MVPVSAEKSALGSLCFPHIQATPWSWAFGFAQAWLELLTRVFQGRRAFRHVTGIAKCKGLTKWFRLELMHVASKWTDISGFLLERSAVTYTFWYHGGPLVSHTLSMTVEWKERLWIVLMHVHIFKITLLLYNIYHIYYIIYHNIYHISYCIYIIYRIISYIIIYHIV